MNTQAAHDFFSDPDRYLAAHYSVQLPYANQEGSPICIDTTHGYADSLVLRHKTHRMLEAAPGYFVLTPRVAASTPMVFQIGSPAL